jgi:hypothetical protein
MSNLPGTNRDLLQAMVSKLLDSSGPTHGNGGTIEFPSVGTFQFSGDPIVIGIDLSSTTQPYSIIIQGDGQGSQSVPLLQKTDGGDLFQVNNSTGSDDHVGGITFRDLQIAYSTVQTSGAAIHVIGSENVRVLRCIFQDCPVGVYFEESLQGFMIDCTAVYPDIGDEAVAGTAVVLGHPTSDNNAIETYIAGCVFQGKSGGTPGSVGIQVNNAEHVRVVNTHIEAFNQGIVISPGGTADPSHDVKRAYFGDVTCSPGSTTDATGAAVLIQPNAGTWVGEIWFVGCSLDAPDGGTSYQGGGVVLDPVGGGGGGGVIDQIRFVNCHVCKWNGPGLQLIGGTVDEEILTNVEVLGGYYSVNGADPASGLPSAGIAIGGAPSGVRITGAACNNSLYFNGAFLTATQDYGIVIGSGALNVFVRGCDLRGNITQAVGSISSVTNVQFTDCAGYNDQATPVRTTPPGTSPFSGTTFGYYGPVAFYTTGGSLTQIAIDGHNTNLTSGSFTLAAGETATLTYSGLPTFIMIGK